MCQNELQAVLYARYSPRPKTSHGRVLECESIETQLERLRAWSVSRGVTILAEYTDEEASGAEADNRPGLQAALRHACASRCILAVYSLSRLARNVGDALEISETLRKAKADMASLSEQIDTSTYMGKFVYTMLAAISQLEREQTSYRTSDAMRRHQATGRRMTHPSKLPFGSRIVANNPALTEPDPDEQKTIKLIVKLHNQKMSARNICRELDKRGIPRRGKTWSGAHPMVRNILAREGIELTT